MELNYDSLRMLSVPHLERIVKEGNIARKAGTPINEEYQTKVQEELNRRINLAKERMGWMEC
jgi:hypothetical protein